ncbi:MAG: hypothetical protein KF893_08630 [Caldilineaceae bacterium]|nr:hypothetical protein [Caldilineaceae bacterium]
MVSASGESAYGQSANQWTPQLRIPRYGDEARPPILVADRNQTVHVFNYQPYDDGHGEAIFYRQWRIDGGWTEPVDILLSPRGGAPRLQAAFLDHNDVIHLILFAGNELQGGIYYSNAPAATANSAQSWSLPRLIGEDAGPIAFAHLSGDGQGNLHAVYSGNWEGLGLYAVHSVDGGNSWSEPETVFLTYSDALFAAHVRSTVDTRGNWHVVWSTVNSIGLGIEVIYARYDPYHMLWTQPVVLAKRAENGYKTDWPVVIEHRGELILFYMDGVPATQFMLRSADGGNTWSNPVRPFPHIGEYASVVLVEDGDERLHIITGFRSGDCCHGMWHGVWLGERWSDLEPIVMGPKTPAFDPSSPGAVISQGNVLLATWWTDTGGLPRNGAWYSYTQLDATQWPVTPLLLPTPTSMPAPTPIPTSTPPQPTPTPNPVVFVQSGDPMQTLTGASAAAVIFLSTLPAILLSLLVIGIYRIRRRDV